MRTLVNPIAVVTVALIAGTLAAGHAPVQASQPDVDTRAQRDVMRRIESAFVRLKANNASMNHVDGERAARRLEALFIEVRTFWQQRRDEQAVRIANRALAATRDTVRASRIMNMAVLATAERQLSSSCEQCHALLRDRPPAGLPPSRRKARMRADKTLSGLSMTFASLLVVLPVASSSSAAGPLEHVERVLAADGLTLADAHVESVTWRRVERFVGATVTTALLGGTYDLYAAGERPEDVLNLTVVNTSNGRAIGVFSLGGSLPPRSGTIVLPAASIVVVAIDPARSVVDRRMSTYNVALGLIRRAPPGKSTVTHVEPRDAARR